MPLLGFGTWQIDNEDAPQATATALELGYRHIDTATGYGNEAGIGAALAASGLDRDAIFITTKLPPEHAGRERQTIEESLTKLGVDHVDLWLVHWPPNGRPRPRSGPRSSRPSRTAWPPTSGSATTRSSRSTSSSRRPASPRR